MFKHYRIIKGTMQEVIEKVNNMEDWRPVGGPQPTGGKTLSLLEGTTIPIEVPEIMQGLIYSPIDLCYADKKTRERIQKQRNAKTNSETD